MSPLITASSPDTVLTGLVDSPPGLVPMNTLYSVAPVDAFQVSVSELMVVAVTVRPVGASGTVTPGVVRISLEAPEVPATLDALTTK